MPAVRTHDYIAVVSGVMMIPVSGAVWLARGNTPIESLINTSMLVGAHLACSHWLSPDLDIDSTIVRRWGIFGFFWKPYGRLIPHRHWLSHSGLSVVLRLLYLFIPLIIIGTGIAMILGYPPDRVTAEIIALVHRYPEQTGLLLAGAVFSDAIHTISDHLSTSYKHMLIRRVRNPSRRARIAWQQAPTRLRTMLLFPWLWLRWRRARQR